jgi:hypothetical protein
MPELLMTWRQFSELFLKKEMKILQENFLNRFLLLQMLMKSPKLSLQSKNKLLPLEFKIQKYSLRSNLTLKLSNS